MTSKPWRSRLCVGGPLAGKFYDTPHDHTRFDVRVLKASAGPAVTSKAGPAATSDEVKIATMTYGIETMHDSRGNEISFWVPLGQTPLETMRLLLEAYARSPNAPSPTGGSEESIPDGAALN